MISFPRHDDAFRRFVEGVIVDGTEYSAAALERRVRTVYPDAVVRMREPLSGFGHETVWYAYRDGRPRSEAAERWWEAPGVAEAAFPDGGMYAQANEEACRLHGLPPGGLVGRRWDEFASPDAVAEAGAMWRRMVDEGWPASGKPIQSTFTLLRADGLEQPVEYRTLPQPDGTFKTWMRPLGEPEPASR